MRIRAIFSTARRRIVAVLFVAQSFYSASTIAAFTLSPIIAAHLSGSDATAGLPNTLTLLGRAAFAYPLGYLMDRVGRRLALSSGYGIAVLGSLVAAWAILADSFAAFMLGALLLGISRSAGDQSRYVGAEVFPLLRRARVIGVIVFAGTFGAIFGPLLVPPSVAWMDSRALPANMGPFVVAGVLMFLATLTVFLFLRPDPRELGQEVARQEAAADPFSLEATVTTKRPLRQIFAAPAVQLALLAMIISYFVMAFLMVITPLHMDHHDHGAGAISNVIMAHTLGMFGLSWLTGWLIDRFGRVTMIISGAVVLMVSCVLAPLSLQVPVLGLALFLLGLGWNFCFVAGTSLLSDALAAHERGRAQGASEALVALGAGSASLAVGLVFEQGDYLLVSGVGLFFATALVIAAVYLMRKDRFTPAPLPGD